MVWYDDLYLGNSLADKPHKVKRIKWKIKHRAGTLNIYLIVLCRYGTNLLEILPSAQLLQKAYPKQDLYVVGLANGYRESLETAARIISDVYQQTDGFAVRKYFQNGIKAGEK